MDFMTCVSACLMSISVTTISIARSSWSRYFCILRRISAVTSLMSLNLWFSKDALLHVRDVPWTSAVDFGLNEAQQEDVTRRQIRPEHRISSAHPPGRERPRGSNDPWTPLTPVYHTVCQCLISRHAWKWDCMLPPPSHTDSLLYMPKLLCQYV